MHLTTGFDIFPMQDRREGHDGSVRTDLFFARLHFLALEEGQVRDYTSFVSPPRTREDALAEVEANIEEQGCPAGTIIQERVLDRMVPFRGSRPRRDSGATTGVVVGHTVTYHPRELVPRLHVLVPFDGRLASVSIRIYGPGDKVLPRDTPPTPELIFREWCKHRISFPVGEEVRIVPRRGVWLLNEPLAEESKEKATAESLLLLKSHLDSRQAASL